MPLRRGTSAVLLLIAGVLAASMSGAGATVGGGNAVPDRESVAGAAVDGEAASIPATTPRALTEEQSFQISVRERFGLETAPDYVRTLEGLQDSWMGIPLSASELEEMERRNYLLLESLDLVKELLKARSRSTFAGAWVDHRAGGVAVVATTERDSVPLAEVRALLPADAVLRVDLVTNTEAELVAQLAELEADRRALALLGIDVVGTPLLLTQNTVAVWLAVGSPPSDVDRVLER